MTIDTPVLIIGVLIILLIILLYNGYMSYSAPSTPVHETRRKTINRGTKHIKRNKKELKKRRVRYAAKEDERPSVAKELQFYFNEVKNGNEEAWLSIGDLCAFGLHGDDTFTPSIERARIYYSRLLNSPQPRLRHSAEERIANLDLHLTGFVARDILIAPNGNTPAMPAAAMPTIAPANNRTREDNLHIRDYITPPAVTPTLEPEVAQVVRTLAPVTSDSQNTHDSSVVLSIKNVIVYLKTNYTKSSKSTVEMRRELAEYRCRDDYKKTQAISAFDIIIKQSSEIAAYGMDHVDALELVWDVAPPENKIEQLASCFEHNHMICQMGRFNKIIDMVTGVEGVPMIKSKDILRRELLDYAALYRKQFDEKLIEQGREEQDEEFKKALIDELEKKYTNGNPPIMSKETLYKEIYEWIDVL